MTDLAACEGSLSSDGARHERVTVAVPTSHVARKVSECARGVDAGWWW